MNEERAVVPADESTALSIPTPGGPLVPEWWARAFGPTCMFRTSLDVRKTEDKAQLLAALTADSPGSADLINTDIRICNYLIQPASTVEQGEIREWVRCVLFLEDGSRVAFGSIGIVKSIMLIQQLDRPAPWHPPIVKRLQVSKLKSGKNWFALVDPPAQPKVKK